MAQSKTDNVQIRVPVSLKRQLVMEAAREGVTIRAIILKALASAGYKIAKDELKDKRKG